MPSTAKKTTNTAPKYRTKGQNSLMFGLAGKLGLTHDDLREMAFDVSGGRTDHTSELYYHEAVKLIDRLQAVANPTDTTPRRTVNYRRQKAGIKQVVTPEHLDKMRSLWFEIHGRTESGLESLTIRMLKVERPRTTFDCNKIIEAIKAMNAREHSKAIAKQKEAA